MLDGAPGSGVAPPPAERAADAGFRILVLNQISPAGLARLPAGRYEVGTELAAPDGILLRSADLHRREIPPSVRAIARAGAGTNNIPVERMSARGIPVFNTPGANANAVKELVLAAMLMSARNVAPALRFVADLGPQDAAMDATVEAGKKAFAGVEIAGRTLGLIGLGKVGCLVADAAIKLGMTVWGYDPHITVEAAWSLPAQVRKAANTDEVLRNSDFVSLHVPLLAATRGMIGAAQLTLMRPSATLLNFSRDAIVVEADVLAALEAQRLASYACDFPSPGVNRHPRVLVLPHLGASTAEAEENCALMAAEQLRECLEHGNIVNAVNFPAVSMPRESPWRVAIANANVPNMLGQISGAMAAAGLNIHNMVNKSRGELAYTLVDVDSAIGPAVLHALGAIGGVLSVRYLPEPDA